ncbi:MAG: MAPEG family protein [Pseudomonadota bacterium]
MTPLNLEVLAPAALLIAWSLVMMFWTVAKRFPAFGKAGIDLGSEPGGRYVDAESQMPARVNWVGHNANHLMEQPTIFYAVVGVLALTTEPGTGALWAWGYLALRVLHSLWQSLVNTVPVRFVIFALSNVCLIVLCYHAVRATITI